MALAKEEEKMENAEGEESRSGGEDLEAEC